MIYHPQSPYKGQHYRLPVELIDIYPTLVNLNDLPFFIGKSCPQDSKCLLRNGQSLAPVILGPNFQRTLPSNSSETTTIAVSAPVMPILAKRYAVTQTLLCALKANLQLVNDPSLPSQDRDLIRSNMWDTCGAHREDEMCLMGYSIRTKSFRYTAYLPFDRQVKKVFNLTLLTEPLTWNPEMEELYEHREDRTGPSLVTRELVNVAKLSKYQSKLRDLRRLLDNFLRPNQRLTVGRARR
jgi:hypothetical protein